jgi:hypothetical protein
MDTFRVETGSGEWWLTGANHKQAAEIILHDQPPGTRLGTMTAVTRISDDETCYFSTVTILGEDKVKYLK